MNAKRIVTMGAVALAVVLGYDLYKSKTGKTS